MPRDYLPGGDTIHDFIHGRKANNGFHGSKEQTGGHSQERKARRHGKLHAGCLDAEVRLSRWHASGL